MSRIEILQAHCNACGGIRNHAVLKKISRSWETPVNERASVWGENEYILLECRGCNAIRLRHKSWFSEETDEDGRPLVNESYYPPSIFRPQAKWFNLLDREWHITKLLQEVYLALQNNAPALASMGIRAIIEAIMIDKVGDKGSFASNLKQFQAQGHISVVQYSVLEAALEIGHASIHRGFIPDAFQLETAIDIVENLVHSLYLLEHRAQASVRSLPKRKD